jgi:hypothetical protein
MTQQSSGDVLAAVLAGHRETLVRKIAAIEADRQDGAISPDQAAWAARGARCVFDRDCELARITDETGWQTWPGVGGVVYAREPRRYPPVPAPPGVVRAPSPGALREAIQGRQ